MPQSLAQNLVHVIFSTKNREPYITGEISTELNSYLAGTLKNLGSPAIIVGSHIDHVHVLFVLSKNHALANIIGEIKKQSSKWIKRKGKTWNSFAWQNGYGAFSVSQSRVESVRQYIENQQEHHRKISFQEELRRFFKKHKIEYDERYLWD